MLILLYYYICSLRTRDRFFPVATHTLVALRGSLTLSCFVSFFKQFLFFFFSVANNSHRLKEGRAPEKRSPGDVSHPSAHSNPSHPFTARSLPPHHLSILALSPSHVHSSPPLGAQQQPQPAAVAQGE